MDSDSKVRVRDTIKKGINGDDARRRRHENLISLRKSSREESVMKRRMAMTEQNSTELALPSLSSSALCTPVKEGSSMSNDQRLSRLPQYVATIKSRSGDVFDAVTNIRKLLSIDKNPHIDEVIEAGAVPHILELLADYSNTKIQFEAAWAITNIASGNSRHTKCAVDAGAIQKFLSILQNASTTMELKEQCVWGLGNIAGDCVAMRDAVLAAGGLQILLTIMHQAVINPPEKPALMRNSTWTLSNLCRGKPMSEWSVIQHAMPAVVHLITNSTDETVLADACWALSYISDDSSEKSYRIEATIQSGVVPKLIELLSNKNLQIRTPALRCIGNLVTGSDTQTQTVINAGVLNPLATLLTNGKKTIRKEAAWAISNITAGTSEQIQSVLSSPILTHLINILKDDEYDVQKEACWALSNATVPCNSAFINTMVHGGVIEPLCQQLNAPDIKMLQVSLEALDNILRVGAKQGLGNRNRFADRVEECGGLDLIENLQRHDNNDVYNRALQILKKYFDIEDNQEEQDKQEIQPGSTSSQFQFGMPAVAEQTKTAPFQFGGVLEKPATGEFNFSSSNTFTFGSVAQSQFSFGAAQ